MIFRRKDYKIKQEQAKNLSILKVFFLEKRGLMNQNHVSFFAECAVKCRFMYGFLY